MNVQEYLTVNGSSPFQSWFNQLNPQAAAKIRVAIALIIVHAGKQIIRHIDQSFGKSPIHYLI
ncbi:hypothetical protein D082_41140 (plasmid) [Synechocystis sp. PCC 6714]|nr:hypothetical protein D082_41140 [Synechocystis sp. PCC 6714]